MPHKRTPPVHRPALRLSLHLPTWSTVTAAAAVLAALLIGLTACSGPQDQDNTAGATSSRTGGPGPQCPSVHPAALALVIGVHQNQPAPDIPSELACLLTSAVENQAAVAVVIVDGSPTITRLGRFTLDTDNDGRRNDDMKRALGSIRKAVQAAAADSNGSDLFAGIKIASDYVRATTRSTVDGYIAVIDAGLPDTGVIDMTRPGMLATDPAEFAKSIDAELRGLHLKGLNVTLVGIGYTSSPQLPLTSAQSDAMSTFWQSVLRTGGATVESTSSPRTGKPPTTPFTTRPVVLTKPPQPPRVRPCTTTTLIYDDASPVGFKPKSNAFRETDAAEIVIRDIARWLLGGSGRSVLITGTTARVDTDTNQVRRAQERARTVATKLVDHGVRPAQITTHGAGSHFPGYIQDHTPEGKLDPLAAVKNRSVRLTLRESRPDCATPQGSR
ncbi:outer membrane protein OmpA-like peptidoglycan-associated protein [Kribbella sp. VKM Ac-2571]|nr:outer membrane protein OmpA-like peptidoglycan-associated protein [Kribbella sp. VKM Ac-2571]